MLSGTDMPRFRYTDHALEQFVTRYERSLMRSEAIRLLNAHSPQAQKLPDRTMRGQEQWLVPNLNMILITSCERGTDHVLTIVPARPVPESFMHDFEDVPEEPRAVETQAEPEPVPVEIPKPAPPAKPKSTPPEDPAIVRGDAMREALRFSIRALAKLAFESSDAEKQTRKAAIESLQHVAKVSPAFLSYRFLSKNGGEALSFAVQNGMARLATRNRFEQTVEDGEEPSVSVLPFENEP